MALEEKQKYIIEDEDGNEIVSANEEPEVVIEGEEEGEQEQEQEQESEQEQEVDDSKETSKKKSKSRAQERIRELVKKNKELEQKYEEEMRQLRSELTSTSKSAVLSQKEHIEARIKAVKKAMASASEEGEFDKATEMLSELNELQTKKFIVESASAKLAKEEADTTTKTASKKEVDDTEALGWIVRNRKWWNQDTVKTKIAVSLGNKLEKEGFDPSSRDYYDALDERIAEFIGEDDSEDTTMDKQTVSASTVKTKKPPQTTAGASRNPASKTGGKQRITLTKDELAIAAKMGISAEDWAKNKWKQQFGTDENGYQIILD